MIEDGRETAIRDVDAGSRVRMLAVEREMFLGAGIDQVGFEATAGTGSAGHEEEHALTVRMLWTIEDIPAGHRETTRGDQTDRAVVVILALRSPRESAA